jgi:hypothetical protein
MIRPGDSGPSGSAQEANDYDDNHQSDYLDVWGMGPTKQSIVNFVRGVTAVGDPRFVKPEERIAVFDNGGTRRSSAIRKSLPG